MVTLLFDAEFQKRYKIHTELQLNTNSVLHTPYSRVSCRITLSDLVKYSMTWSIARPLYDSRARACQCPRFRAIFFCLSYC